MDPMNSYCFCFRLAAGPCNIINGAVQILENVREKDVFVIQPLTEPVAEMVMELFIVMAIIDKRRVADTEVFQGLVVGEVKGRDAIIFEDEISTGGTLITTVDTLQAGGVRRLFVGATHGGALLVLLIREGSIPPLSQH